MAYQDFTKRKSVFQKISKKISKKNAVSDHEKMRRAFYCIRHYFGVKLSEHEYELMRAWIEKRGLVERRDELNNADYDLVCSLFNLKNERYL